MLLLIWSLSPWVYPFLLPEPCFPQFPFVVLLVSELGTYPAGYLCPVQLQKCLPFAVFGEVEVGWALAAVVVLTSAATVAEE